MSTTKITFFYWESDIKLVHDIPMGKYFTADIGQYKNIACIKGFDTVISLDGNHTWGVHAEVNNYVEYNAEIRLTQIKPK